MSLVLELSMSLDLELVRTLDHGQGSGLDCLASRLMPVVEGRLVVECQTPRLQWVENCFARPERRVHRVRPERDRWGGGRKTSVDMRGGGKKKARRTVFYLQKLSE